MVSGGQGGRRPLRLLLRPVHPPFAAGLDGLPLDDVLIIVDEAHNLPDYTREIESFELSRVHARRGVQKEVDGVRRPGDPPRGQHHGRASSSCGSMLDEAVRGVPDRRGRPHSAIVPGGRADDAPSPPHPGPLRSPAKADHGARGDHQGTEHRPGTVCRARTSSPLGAFLSYWFTPTSGPSSS